MPQWLKVDHAQPVPDWLRRIEVGPPGHFQKVPFPLDSVLERSVYYPASGLDGRAVQFLGGFAHSFIHVDYGLSAQNLEDEIASPGFAGYRLADSRSVSQAELAPQGWTVHIPEHLRSRLRAPPDWVQQPFCRWMIFDREPDHGGSYGPERFSLVHLCADGVAAYQVLYHANSVAPMVLVIIQPGRGFGGNYTNFTDPDDFLAWTVLRMGNPEIPAYLVCGGLMFAYHHSFWPDEYPHYEGYFQHPGGNCIWRQRSVPPGHLGAVRRGIAA